MSDLAFLVFLVSLAWLLVAHVCLPLGWIALGMIRPRGLIEGGGRAPTIAVVVAARNQADVLKAKLNRLLQGMNSSAISELVVVSDGSDDETESQVLAIDDPRVRLIPLPRPVGVNEAFASGVRATRSDLLFLTDAGSELDDRGLSRLAHHFADPRVAMVNGRYVPSTLGGGLGSWGYRAYWKVESLVKAGQACVGLSTTVTGAVLMLRRSWFQEVPSAFSSDIFLPMRTQARGGRVVYDSGVQLRAVSGDSDVNEFERRVRIQVRVLTSLPYIAARVPPTRHGLLWLALTGNRLLRYFTWMPLLVAFLTTLVLVPTRPEFLWVLLAELASLGLGGLSLVAGRLGSRSSLAGLPFFFWMLQIAGICAFVRACRGDRIADWEPTA